MARSPNPTAPVRALLTPLGDGRPTRLTVWAGWLLVVISAVHLALFLVQAALLGHVTDWVTGGQLSMATWDPVMSQSQAAFWLAPGSFAVPMMLLGLLIVRLARSGLSTPPFVIWGLAAWAVFGSAILEPSGLPLGLVPVGLLLLARRDRAVN